VGVFLLDLTLAVCFCLFDVGAGDDASLLLPNDDPVRPSEPPQAMAQVLWSIHSGEGRPERVPHREFANGHVAISKGPPDETLDFPV
jgi:hypothetical protein